MKEDSKSPGGGRKKKLNKAEMNEKQRVRSRNLRREMKALFTELGEILGCSPKEKVKAIVSLAIQRLREQSSLIEQLSGQSGMHLNVRSTGLNMSTGSNVSTGSNASVLSNQGINTNNSSSSSHHFATGGGANNVSGSSFSFNNSNSNNTTSSNPFHEGLHLSGEQLAAALAMGRAQAVQRQQLEAQLMYHQAQKNYDQFAAEAGNPAPSAGWAGAAQGASAHPNQAQAQAQAQAHAALAYRQVQLAQAQAQAQLEARRLAQARYAMDQQYAMMAGGRGGAAGGRGESESSLTPGLTGMSLEEGRVNAGSIGGGLSGDLGSMGLLETMSSGLLHSDVLPYDLTASILSRPASMDTLVNNLNLSGSGGALDFSLPPSNMGSATFLPPGAGTGVDPSTIFPATAGGGGEPMITTTTTTTSSSSSSHPNNAPYNHLDDDHPAKRKFNRSIPSETLPLVRDIKPSRPTKRMRVRRSASGQRPTASSHNYREGQDDDGSLSEEFSSEY